MMSTAYEKGGSRGGERLALQQEFLGFTENIRRHTVDMLPDLSEGLNHKGLISTMERPFSGAEDQLLITQPELSSLLGYGNDTLPNRMSFAFKPGLEIGKADSRRMVSFGVADLTWFDGAHEPKKIPLAVKTFDIPKSERTFLHELAFMQHCANVGIQAPKVFGVAQYQGGTKAALLTHLEPDLITLDNLSWREMSEDEQDYHLQAAIETLALLHENAMFHGDAEFKNIAFKEKQGEVIVVDMEFGTSLREFPESDLLITKWAQAMSGDFRAVRTSLERAHVLQGSDMEQLNQFLARFTIPYIERIQHSNSEYKKQLHEAYDRVVQAFTAEAVGEEFGGILQGVVGRFALK